ncbi:Aspartyl protease [Phytophthora megakarya]|uniref:Aspartyl protease n=1 Tax=Phytophthora megakarya TaxID=4795 RepID=A0A225X4X7_9STRA|nr:Aspartyl protease [Phytophthora megakarya]
MVRVIASFPAVLMAVSTLSAVAEQEGVTMQLHRMPKHDIHPERYARRLNSEEDAPELVPLHLGLGTHYTWVYAGTPPQRASVIADTGSALMAFPCSGCDGCGKHTDAYFQADNSSTLVHVTCSQKSFFQCKECRVTSDTCAISQSYMEGSSWKASVVEDVVYLGGEASFQDEEMRNRYGTHFQFGCQSSETGLFVTQVADGIMGLSNTENHIVAKLHRENKIANNLFSLCFTENGGTMSVGQSHKAAHRGEVSYAKVIADRSAGHFYNVHMKDIRIGGKSINAKEEAFARGHYIVDSGTTDSYLPRLMKTEFLQAFKAVSGRDYQVGSSCKGFTNEDLASLPTIQLVMEAYGDENAEVILDVPPEQYLIDTNGAYCGGIYLSENSGGVIGANLMMNRDVIFDLGNQRVGFVDADCAYESGANATAAPSIHKGATTSQVPTATKPAAPIAPSTIANTAAPISAATFTPSAAATVSTPEPQSIPATTEPASATAKTTAAPAPVSVATAANTSAHSGSITIDLNIQPLSDETTITTQSSSSAAMGDSKEKEKSSGTHPMVLTIVGAVLVVGFLLMMLISVSRRKQKDGKEQLWSRVKGDDEDEDDDDEEEFGLVRNDKKKAVTTKHQRLNQDDDDDNNGQSSSDEEDEVFDRQSVQESKVDNRTLDRL